ncbi:MAG: hypothetical protein JWO38_7616 [Gemmataceae bacterium]|nr:hypothetical protein [Gemmataceae bacterium]
MSARTSLTFRREDLRAVSTERYQHPDPRVRQRMEVLWLIRQGETRARAAVLAGVSRATVGRDGAVFRDGGVAGLREFRWVKPTSVLETHGPALGDEFRARPPHPVAGARQRIQDRTGVGRGEAQVRMVLKKLSAWGTGGRVRSRCRPKKRSTSTTRPRRRFSGTNGSRR